jgi:hypothetical protein
MQMVWTTVYDFGNESLQIGRMIIPVFLVLIGYSISVFNIFFNKSKGGKKSYYIIFGIFFGTFALLFGAMTIPGNFLTYYETKEIYESKKYKIVEGLVENFDPMPYGGHKNETFTLNGIEFSYSDFVGGYGFNNTKSHGGPIDQNKKVRLTYFKLHDKNIILKIEVPK